MALFPNNPSVGDTVSFGQVVYEWNGTEWISLGEVRGIQGPRGGTGPIGNTGPSITGEKGDTGADSTVAGPIGNTGEKGDTGEQGPIGNTGPAGSGGSGGSGSVVSPYVPSAAGFVTADSVSGIVTLTQAQYDGITGGPSGDVVYMISDAADSGGGGTYVAGDGLSLSAGNTFSIDSTAVVHVAGVSSDGRINIPQDEYIGISGDSQVQFQIGAIRHKPSGVLSFVSSSSSVVAHKPFNSVNLLTASSGVNVSSGGITFPDGSYQTTSPADLDGTITSPFTPSTAGFVTADSVSGVVTLTQAQYDNIIGGPSGDVVYMISDAIDSSGTVISPYVPSAAGFVTADSVNGIVSLTQAQYDGITGGPSGDVVYMISDAAPLEVVSLLNGLSGGITLNAGSNMSISSGVGGITLNASVSGSAGATYYGGDGLTLSAGNTFSVDSTAVVHVAGVTTPDNGQLGNESGTFVELQSTQVRLKPTGVLSFASLSTKNISHKQMQVQQEFIANGVIESNAGILFDTGTGITFADGTYQSTAPVVSLSYNGLLESPTNKTYRLDRYTVEARTFNFLYVDCVTGGCSADFYAAGSTLSNTLNVTPSGASASFATAVPAGSTFSLVLSGITTGNLVEDFGYVVGYTQ